MKKNKVLPLITLLALLAVLVTAYVLLTGYNEKKAAEEAAESDSTVQEISVISVNFSDVTAISYKTGETDVSLSLAGGIWIIPDDEKYPVDQSAVAEMLSAVTSISATRELDGGDAADFGLDEPSLTVTLTAGGMEHSVTLGDVNNYNDLTYLGYNGKVYMISDTLSSVFDADKEDLFGAADSFPAAITPDSVASVTVTNAKGDSTSVTDADGIEDAVFDAQKYLSFAILKGYGLDETGLADYGISSDSGKIIVEYTYNGAKASFEALLGKDADGNCYYTVPGSTTAYGIDVTGYDKLMSYAYYTPAETTAE